MTKLPDLQEALGPVIQDAVDAALARLGTGLLIERVEADARLQDALGPVVLHRQEAIILASMVEGTVSPDDLDGLGERHFYGRGHALVFRLLRQAMEGGEVLGWVGLAEWLLADCHTTTATVALLLREIEQRATVDGQEARIIVAELVAAAAWNDFAREVRSIGAGLRLQVATADARGLTVGLDVAGLRKRLRGANLALADGLKVTT